MNAMDETIRAVKEAQREETEKVLQAKYRRRIYQHSRGLQQWSEFLEEVCIQLPRCSAEELDFISRAIEAEEEKREALASML